jgi:hypothetical protein
MKSHITRLSPPNEFDQVVYGTYCLVLDSYGDLEEVYIQNSKDDDEPEWVVVDKYKYNYKDNILTVLDNP